MIPLDWLVTGRNARVLLLLAAAVVLPLAAWYALASGRGDAWTALLIAGAGAAAVLVYWPRKRAPAE